MSKPRYQATAVTPIDKAKKEPATIVRKLGDSIESFEEKISPAEMAELGRITIATLAEEEGCVEAFKEMRDNHKSELTKIRRRRSDARRMLASGIKRVEATVEEFLTVNNEVVRVRTDTGESLAARNATKDELQEELPLDRPSAAPADDFPDSDAAFGGSDLH